MLFKKKKSQSSEDTGVGMIRPVVVRTENVAKELHNVAVANGVAPATLDFNLLEVRTMKRMADDAEWEELSFEDAGELAKDVKAILNEKLQIRQTYEVEIFTKTEPDPFDTLNYAIGANGTLCKAFMSIKEGASVSYFEGFSEALKRHINKKKLRARLLIWMFDEPMADTIKQISNRARVAETLKFEAKETLQVAESIEPNPTVNDALILHFDKKRQESQQASGDRVDHSKRGFIVSVDANELLIEYVKPRKGTAGRNCRGELILPTEPVVANEPNFGVSEKLEMKDSETNIEYWSKQSGYVTFENGAYDISTEMDISEISFKTTGSIEAGLETDVTLNVKEKDAFKDAIGMGMEVEVNEIQIEGNTGPSSKIRANKARIDGQTHQSSEVRADELQINIHKGKAYGKNIHITRLEHGTVEGESVTIAQAIGGKIRAKEIKIELLGSHVTMTATDLIEIQQLKGEENVFIIDPVVMHSSKEDLQENETKIVDLKRELLSIEQEIEKDAKTLSDNSAAFVDLKKRLLQYKKSGVQMPTAFVKKYKQFQHMQSKVEGLKREHAQKTERLEMLSSRQNAFQSDIFQSKVICHDQWKGHNDIIFKMIEPAIEVALVPPEYASDTVYMLKNDEDDDHYYIAPVLT